MRKERLAIAVAGAVGIMASTAQAVDFNASGTLQNTLAVTVVQDFDIGTVFAVANGVDAAAGVGALVIAPSGSVSEPAGGDSTTVNLTSLIAPVPAQGSVAMASDFSLKLPTTTTISATTFGAAGSAAISVPANNAAALVHESSDPDIPNLYLMHFTVEAVSGGSVTDVGAGESTPVLNRGDFAVTQDFGETEFIFNIGATLTTEPYNGTDASEKYQPGVYSGTFEVLAAY